MPSEKAEVLYTVTAKKVARGWVSELMSPFWPALALSELGLFDRNARSHRNAQEFPVLD